MFPLFLQSSNRHSRGAADLNGKGDVEMAGTSDATDGGADMAQFFAEVCSSSPTCLDASPEHQIWSFG